VARLVALTSGVSVRHFVNSNFCIFCEVFVKFRTVLPTVP